MLYLQWIGMKVRLQHPLPILSSLAAVIWPPSLQSVLPTLLSLSWRHVPRLPSPLTGEGHPTESYRPISSRSRAKGRAAGTAVLLANSTVKRRYAYLCATHSKSRYVSDCRAATAAARVRALLSSSALALCARSALARRTPKGFTADFGMNEGHAQKWARQPRLTGFHLVSNSVIFGAVLTDIHYKSHQVQKIEQICTPTNRASLDAPTGRWYLEYLPRVCGYWYVYCGNEHPRNFTASAGIAVQWASPSPRWQQWPVVGGRALSLCDSGEAHKVRWAISSQNTPCPQAEIKSTSYDCCGAAAARTRGSSLWELNWRPANSQFWRQHRLRWDLSWNTQSKYRPN